MKHLKLYHIPIMYMIPYTLAILGTGIWSFLLSQGLTESGSVIAVFQRIVLSPIEKSMHNFIEISTPHLFAMGVLIFVVAHFMIFSTKIKHKTSMMLALLLFVLALFNISAYLLIMSGLLTSGWIKLISMSLFVGTFLILLGMVTFSL